MSNLALFQLKGKVAVVTGGTGVLGRAMAEGLCEAGARVVILGRRLDAGEAIALTLMRKGYEACAVAADVLNQDELRTARETMRSRFGSIDILVNAAGGNMPGAVVTPDKSFFNLGIDDIRKVIDLNLLGSVLPTLVFAESMTSHRHGVIINISSETTFRPITRVVGYSAAKAAINNFTAWLAVEMASKYGEHIRVNAIAPGFFLTEQNRDLLTNADGSLTERAQLIIQHTPFGRFGKPEELKGTLVWLCSDAAAFVTGAVIPVDGGFHAFSGV